MVEHGLVPGAVPRLDIGFDLPQEVGMRPLLVGKAFCTERAHLAVETLHVNRPRLMVLDHDFPLCLPIMPSERSADGDRRAK